MATAFAFPPWPPGEQSLVIKVPDGEKNGRIAAF